MIIICEGIDFMVLWKNAMVFVGGFVAVFMVFKRVLNDIINLG